MNGNIFLALCLIIPASLAAYPDENIDEMQTVCSAINSKDETKFQISTLDKPLLYRDVLKMITWNYKYNLKGGDKRFDFPSTAWRRPIIQEILEVFQKTCPKAYIPAEFLNVLREFIMIYFNSAVAVPDASQKWNSFLGILKACNEKAVALDLEDNGLTIESIKVGQTYLKLILPKEAFDEVEAIDPIVDSLWWLFTTSFGTCYKNAGQRASWAYKYKKRFYEDFLVPLLNRWGNAGSNPSSYDVIFGNFDVRSIFLNMRLCSTAAFTAVGIVDRQLVRPVKLRPKNSFNFKTGNPL